MCKTLCPHCYKACLQQICPVTGRKLTYPCFVFWLILTVYNQRLAKLSLSLSSGGKGPIRGFSQPIRGQYFSRKPITSERAPPAFVRSPDISSNGHFLNQTFPQNWQFPKWEKSGWGNLWLGKCPSEEMSGTPFVQPYLLQIYFVFNVCKISIFFEKTGD